MGGPGFEHAGMSQLKRILKSPLFRYLIGFIISGLTLYLSFQNINLNDILYQLSQTNLVFLSLAVISLGVGFLFKIIRWKILLGLRCSSVYLSQIGMSYLVAQMMNTFLGFRLGEVSRVYILGRTGIEHAFVVGTIAIEMVLNMIATSFLFVLLLLIIPLPDWIEASGLAYLTVVVILAMVIFFATLYRSRLFEILFRWIRHIPGRLQPFLLTHVRNGLSSLEVLGSYSDLSKLAVLTTIIWIVAVLTNHLVLMSLELDLPIAAALLVLVTMQVAVFIPSIPGKVGVFEYICILSLGVYGVNQTLALSYGILLHLAVYLPTIILGLVSLWVLRLDSKGENLTLIE